MGSQDSNMDLERQPLRQRALAKRLAEAFAQIESMGAAAGECPDGELIASYQENALAPDQAEPWEGHFAACSRCRKILAVLAASADVPLAETEVARLGALAGSGSGEVRRTTALRGGWQRWLAPAATVAAVLVVWIAMRAPWRPAQTSSVDVMVAQAPPPEARPGEAARAEPAQQALPEPQPAAPAPALAEGTISRSAQLSEPASSAPPRAAARASTETRTEVMAQSAVLAEGDALRANRAPADQARTRKDEESPKMAASDQAARIAVATAPDALVLVSPSGAVSWRAGRAGLIERSLDGGRTWVAQASPLQQDWLAGAAVSDRVAWLAGRNGALARTLDGERWERVEPPGGPAPADWMAVSASDAQSATITAGDGRRYATSDGGRQWQPR